MCAGIVDKHLSLEEIAKEEVLEECGYDVPLLDLQKIASYRYVFKILDFFVSLARHKLYFVSTKLRYLHGVVCSSKEVTLAACFWVLACCCTLLNIGLLN